MSFNCDDLYGIIRIYYGSISKEGVYMEIMQVKSEQIIARKNDKVKYWYIVSEGAVIQKFDFTEIRYEKNSIIGMSEKDVYLCDYLAAEDTTLACFECECHKDLKTAINGQENVRGAFVRAALEQRHQILCAYSELFSCVRQFHSFIEQLYLDYKSICNRLKIEEMAFARIEHFKAIKMVHRAEAWEVNNSISVVRDYMQEYINLIKKDDSLTIGAIMEAAAQMRRFSMGIVEMENYLHYNMDILIAPKKNDMFNLYFELAATAKAKKHNIEEISAKLESVARFARKLPVYNKRLVNRRLEEYKNSDFEGNAQNSGQLRKEIDIMTVDSVSVILEYAGYDDEAADEISMMIEEYRTLPDRNSSEQSVYTKRKKLTAVFYEIYYRAFIRAVNDERSMPWVVEMFLNFGFVSTGFIEEERCRELYELVSHLEICNSDHIYTIYQWLRSIYYGEKEPSKNELDMNYSSYIANEWKMGRITANGAKEAMDDQNKKVEYEIKNMCASVNRATYGKITTFCPILSDYDLINTVEKMLVTAERIDEAINEIRKLDYSVFYREVTFSDVNRGINAERIMKEVLPDVILMPNAGSRGMMWQEIADVRNDTPARIMFPLFTSADLDDMMLEVVGRYRWEMCRRVQGVYWNDVREASLTAEYYSYLQFYRHNHDLSTEAKEKIKNSIARAKNNYREVFVRDYINWIKYESKGSFRLNKLSRDILVRYCPFVKSVRTELKNNPMYQSSIGKFENDNSKKLIRYKSLYDKYEKTGGTITDELKGNMMYYQM